MTLHKTIILSYLGLVLFFPSVRKCNIVNLCKLYASFLVSVLEKPCNILLDVTKHVFLVIGKQFPYVIVILVFEIFSRVLFAKMILQSSSWYIVPLYSGANGYILLTTALIPLVRSSIDSFARFLFLLCSLGI